VSGITYDTAALVAAEGGDRRMWAMHRRAIERLHTPTIPAGVLAQAWRGGPQPSLSWLLDGCWIEPLDEPGAWEAGQLLGRAQSADAIEASVVAGALRRGDAVVTSDGRDIETLANTIGSRIGVIAV
jgi:hypothetical protein